MADLQKAVETPAARKTKITRLRPHPRNYRSHPQEQIEHIRASLREHGFYRNVVAAKDLTILAGHGVVMAAEQEGMTSVPVIVIDTEPDSSQALKILAGDNFVAQMSEDDEEALRNVLADIRVDDALLGTGFDEVPDPFGNDGDSGDSGDSGGGKEVYTRKITAPTYVPKGEAPPPSAELCDPTKTNELIGEINEADLPDDVRDFLVLAAHRHTKFRFDRIAEFYSHADADVQRLGVTHPRLHHIIDWNAAVPKIVPDTYCKLG